MKPMLRMCVCLSCLALFVLSVTTVWANPTEQDFIDQTVLDGGSEAHFVTPPKFPTDVEVTFSLLRINSIDPPSERFPTMNIEGFFEVDWHDPRLAQDPANADAVEETFLGKDAELELELIWWPDIIIQNELHKREIEDMELIIHPDGEVDYRERFFATIPLDFDLHKFPFDAQKVHIDLESFSWDDKHLILKPGKRQSTIGPDVHLMDWRVESVEQEYLDVFETRAAEKFSEMQFTIVIEREAWHYVKTIFLPLGIILFMLSCIVYADLDKRIEFILIALLSLVAFNGIIAEDLPKLKDMIFLDVLVLLGYIITLFALVESVVAQRMRAVGQAERAERMEQTNRKIFPYIMALIVVGGVLGYII